MSIQRRNSALKHIYLKKAMSFPRGQGVVFIDEEIIFENEDFLVEAERVESYDAVYEDLPPLDMEAGRAESPDALYEDLPPLDMEAEPPDPTHEDLPVSNAEAVQSDPSHDELSMEAESVESPDPTHENLSVLNAEAVESDPAHDELPRIISPDVENLQSEPVSRELPLDSMDTQPPVASSNERQNASTESSEASNPPNAIIVLPAGPELAQYDISHEVLSDVLCVSGNQHKSFTFLAVRFTNPVIVLKHFGGDCNPIDIPRSTCMLVEASNRPLQVRYVGTPLMFVMPANSNATPTEHSILLSFFPRTSVIFSVFDRETLYIVTTRNPFKKIWKRARKTKAFEALKTFLECCVLHTSKCMFDINTAALMRHFKRNTRDINVISTWYALAFAMVQRDTVRHHGRDPCALFGKRLFQIAERTEHFVPLPHLPPPDFYTCQITFGNEHPVGIAFRLINGKVEYVSLMIISYTKEWYLDANNKACCFVPTSKLTLCRNWFPLFKDILTWRTFGCQFYESNLERYKRILMALLDWLSIQKTEPHRHIKNDLLQVYQLLNGSVETRWSLNH